jgi:hypothetical protein
MQNLAAIIEALSRTIDINHRTILNDLTSKLPLGDQSNPTPVEVIDDEMGEENDADASLRRLKEEQPSALEQEVKLVGYLLSAQRMSAEILSNICTPEDEDAYEDIDDKSDAESVHDYDVTEMQNDSDMNGNQISVEVAEGVKAHNIVEKVRKSDLNSFRKCLKFILLLVVGSSSTSSRKCSTNFG